MSGRDHALEVRVVQRVVLDMDRETLDARLAWAVGHRPALQGAIELEAKIVVELARLVLLDDEA